MLGPLPLSLLSLLISSLVPTASALWPFPSKRFTANAFVDAQTLGLDDLGRIVAFGDFDGNQFLDVVGLAASTSPVSEQNLLHIYTWSHSDFQFHKNSSIQSPDSNKIVNVVPADFTHDGKLDLLVMTISGNKLSHWLYVGNGAKGFEASPVSIPPSTLSQPMPLDVNGNLRLDMVGNVPPGRDGNTDKGSALMVWKNVWEATNGTVLFDTAFFNDSANATDAPKCLLGDPHSSAVLDFDGDCLADLFFTCKEPNSDRFSYQIWLNDPKGGGFKLAQKGLLPKGAGMVSFADMDRDGTIDMVFPVCESVDAAGVGHGCSVNVAYNKQIGFCNAGLGQKETGDCRRPDTLCKADPNFKFDLTETSEIMMTIPVMTLLRYTSTTPDTKTSSILMMDTTHSPPIPLALKLGDADLDGFPDILFISVTPDDGRVPKLAWSVPCTVNEPGCPTSTMSVEENPPARPVKPGSGVGGRGFATATPNGDASVLANFRDARGVTFLDLDEDGTLDILIQRSGTGSGGGGVGGGQKINFIQNNVFHDAFFMKAIVLNGACGGLCTPKVTGEVAYHPFGVSYSGATYKYTILDTTGKRSAAQIAQLPQTSYHSLQTPYSFFGLGRTNNYIENLFVGSTRKPQKPTPHSLLERTPNSYLDDREVSLRYQRAPPPATPPNSSTPSVPFGEGIHYISMEGVIPNSKVVIIPPSAPGFGEWRRELYLRPGEWIPWVTVTLVVATIILGIIVYAFHWNESREDERERRKALHNINFDAL